MAPVLQRGLHYVEDRHREVEGPNLALSRIDTPEGEQVPGFRVDGNTSQPPQERRGSPET